MRTQLDKDDAYYFNQNEVDVDDLLEKNQIDVESDKYRMEKQRYAEELSWFSDNLKKKVPWFYFKLSSLLKLLEVSRFVSPSWEAKSFWNLF